MKKNTIIKSTASVISAALLVFAMGSGAHATGDNLIDNSSFENPTISVGQNSVMENDADVPGWQTTDSHGKFEFWSHNNGWEAEGDAQYIELNAYSNGAVYQDVTTTACDVLTWTVWHRARFVGTDVMHVLFGAAGGTGADGLTAAKASTRDDASITKTTEIADEVGVQEDDSQENWHSWSGTYQVPAGQTSTRVAFAAVSSAANDPTIGNFIDDVTVTAEHGTCASASALASTGYDAMPLTLGGSAAVLAGIAALVVARRRTAKK